MRIKSLRRVQTRSKRAINHWRIAMWNGSRLAAVVTLACTLVACGGDKPTENVTGSCGVTGTFSGNATGTAASSLSGCSYYAVSSSEEGPMFGLVMTHGTSMQTITHTISVGREGNRPGTGTYSFSTDVGSVDFAGTVFVDAGNRMFLIESGTITITTSNSSTLAGSLNVTGRDETNATITVTGNFSATCTQGSSNGVPFTC
jgi:hypothetical protein